MQKSKEISKKNITKFSSLQCTVGGWRRTWRWCSANLASCQGNLVCCSSCIGACLRCWPSVATAAALETAPCSRVAWCRSRGRRRGPSGRSHKVRGRCTRAGCWWSAQLDVQIGFEQSTLGWGGQGVLSTSFPHTAVGVENAEELPMVGVDHPLVKKTETLSRHF